MSADLFALLDAAVSGVSGVRREGQVAMTEAVREAVQTRRHLLVQAGTGTGKSLAYLIPAIVHAIDTGKPVVVATATLALQAQIVDRELPRLAVSLAPLLPRMPTFALVKGRSNYVCVHKLAGGYPDEDQGALLSVGGMQRRDGDASRVGAEVIRLRDWAQQTDTGDRDDLVPGVSGRAWREVSVSARECLGGKCPMVTECFVEQARALAREVDLVVTNHAFMAIDATEGRYLLPEHDVLILDEAHELTDRFTSTITQDLAGGLVVAAAKRAGKLTQTDVLAESADTLDQAITAVPEGRIRDLPASLTAALTLVNGHAREVLSQLKPPPGQRDEVGDTTRAVARASVEEVLSVTKRLLEARELDVVWTVADPRRGAYLRVAPMSVAMLIRDAVLTDRTVVFTSATLTLGGSFDPVAGSFGLRGQDAPPWRGLDVGSPFDYPKQGIVYVAAHLPAPGRDGLGEEVLAEIEALVSAAGGRTLGLFSSMRAAQSAAEQLRDRIGELTPVLCQGEDQLPTLVRRFAADARTCLFGTLSLWQGVDVPGPACQLVLIDRIPFPRPDEPLASARTETIARMGGNGFMAVSATHAALRLAQGAGRLIRRDQDRGVVAVLDSRMVTARYAPFLQSTLPSFWPTVDRAVVLDALRRLDASAPPVVPVLDLRDQRGSAPVSQATATDTDGDADPDGTTSVDGQGRNEPTGPAVVATDAPVPASSRTAVTAGQSWTPELDRELAEAAELGLTLEEVADHLDLEVAAVAGRIRTIGLHLLETPVDPSPGLFEP